MKLSIVVPFYRVEKYIRQCLESIAMQDVPEGTFETILVDDGSDDGSTEIARSFVSAHPGAVLLSQPNRGLSEARNAGLGAARGEYVWFVDSDDTIAPGSVRRIVEAMDGERLDALHFRLVRICCGSEEHETPRGSRIVVPGRVLASGRKLNCCAVLTVFRRQALLEHALSFYPGIFHEDLEFIPRAYYHMDRVLSVDDELYLNRRRPGSIMTSVNPKKGMDMLVVAEHLEAFIRAAVEPELRRGYGNYVAMALDSAAKNAALMSRGEFAEFMKEWKNARPQLCRMRRSSLFKNRLEGLALSFAPRLSIRLLGLRVRLSSSRICGLFL